LPLVASLGGTGGLALPKMPPRMTPEEFQATVAQADSAIVDWAWEGKKKSAFMEDPKWIAELKGALGAAKLKPTPFCFCIGQPEIELLAGGKSVGRLETKHENLSFSSRGAGGDFHADPETMARLRALLLLAEARARPKEDPRRRPAPPGKVELQP
jgi:hypothetical protein